MEDQADRRLLETMRRRGAMTISELTTAAAVTATAVRHRLSRLMASGLVDRSEQHAGRGRPRHTYFVTAHAHAMLGQNYQDLAMTLWRELKGMEDRAVGMSVLRRVADRMAADYRRRMPSIDVQQRMNELRELLAARGVDVEVTTNGELPILRQHSCPYHELATSDRTVCGVEMRIFEKALDSDVTLAMCRLDGHPCCEFEVRPADIKV